MSHFRLFFPLIMLSTPALFIVLWGWLTGAPGILRPLLGSLAAIAAYGVCIPLVGWDVVMSSWYSQLWAMGGFFVVFLGFGMPWVRASFAALPEPQPKAASLRPRKIELFPGAFAWPYVAWAGLVAWMAWKGMPKPIAWVGPAIGMIGLLIVRPCLEASVREPEPLGGPEPERIAARYEQFRRRRVYGMYWLTVVIALFSTISWTAAFHPRFGGIFGGLAGAAIGMYGALFGAWADAQRYLLRRQIAEMQAHSAG